VTTSCVSHILKLLDKEETWLELWYFTFLFVFKFSNFQNWVGLGWIGLDWVATP
jgi:hypothetical protein